MTVHLNTANKVNWKTLLKIPD